MRVTFAATAPQLLRGAAGDAGGRKPRPAPRIRFRTDEGLEGASAAVGIAQASSAACAARPDVPPLPRDAPVEAAVAIERAHELHLVEAARLRCQQLAHETHLPARTPSASRPAEFAPSATIRRPPLGRAYRVPAGLGAARAAHRPRSPPTPRRTPDRRARPAWSSRRTSRCGRRDARFGHAAVHRGVDACEPRPL